MRIAKDYTPYNLHNNSITVHYTKSEREKDFHLSRETNVYM